ncbi:MAG: VWA domain-containing protein [Proteobacteria bacterium]|nr:VWA domain-containing protein [Pseudomonadota bacterium]
MTISPRFKLTVGLGICAVVAAFLAPRLNAFAVPNDPDQPTVADAELPPPDDKPLVEEETPQIAEVKPDPRPDPKPTPRPQPVKTRPVDIVICLDNSGSMEGLIDSARAKLWEIVNEVLVVEPNAQLRVGLISFGSPIDGVEVSGWVVKQMDLTNDLDTLYAKMMALKTDGGEEYVGWAIHDAVEKMAWSTKANAAHLVYVAGNESADQGRDSFNFRHVSTQAREKKILISTIFAGNVQTGRDLKWGAVAKNGGGTYAAIDMNAGIKQIVTPQDKALIELNEALNGTYIPYGSRGEAGLENQIAQDNNSDQTSSLTTRVSTKGSSAYVNPFWDLVDAFTLNSIDVGSLADGDLPTAMQGLNEEDRLRYIEEKIAEREKIKEEIRQLTEERQGVLEKERAKRAVDGFDDAMRESLEQML